MKIELDKTESNSIQAFADLKKVPLWKILRNAGRDFAQAAFRETPIGKKGFFEGYAKINGHYIRPANEAELDRFKRLKAMVPIVRGFSRATWIGIFKGLGINLGRRAKGRAATAGRSILDKKSEEPSVTITNGIQFDTISPMGRMIEAGFKNAADRIEKEWQRQILKKWNKIL